MRIVISLLVAFAMTSFAKEPYHRYGEWNWPSSLQELWEPIFALSDLEVFAERVDGSTAATRSAEHIRFFARNARPEVVVPDMIADLKAHPNQDHYFVYLAVMREWPAQRVLSVLLPFRYSSNYPIVRSVVPLPCPPLSDPAIARIADEFAVDIEGSN